MRENLLQGPRIFFDEDWNFIGLDGREQFDLGSMNAHTDYNSGNRNNYQEDLIRSIGIDDSFTYLKSGWGGDHTFRVGGGWSRFGAFRRGRPRTSSALFDFRPTLHSIRRTRAHIRVASASGWARSTSSRRTGARTSTCRTSGRWAEQITLNLGLRYDYQDLTPLDQGRVRAARSAWPTTRSATVEDAAARRRRQVLSVSSVDRASDAAHRLP